MSKPSPEKRARQARRAAASSARKQRRLSASERLAARFIACVERWKRLPVGEHVEESCMFCGALVIVVNGADSFDCKHALPACDFWTTGLLADGAHSPRVETVRR